VGDDDIVPVFKAFAERIHRHDCALMIQLTHMGRRAHWSSGDWLPTVAPSRVREPAHRSFPKALERADIQRIARDFASAARRCQRGGLDGVEIAALGQLLGQFWSPAVNRRSDEYGGSLENRMR
jgi:2,4-dienoyl-CoA reductase-like NADH-dependent reductase (Old Yellow Enzyme family)